MDVAALVHRHLDLAPRQFDQWLEIVHDDVILELPYGPSAGFPARMIGKDAISEVIPAYFARLPAVEFRGREIFPGINMGEAFATYAISTEVADTGRTYNQSYVGHFRASGGLLTHIVEWFDTIVAREALQA